MLNRSIVTNNAAEFLRSLVTQIPTKRIIDLASIEELCREPALSEQALIDNALKFANTGDLRAFRNVSGIIEMMQLPTAFYEEERTALRVALTDIINAREDKTGAPAHAVLWRKRRSRVVDVFDEDGGQHFMVLDSLPRAPGTLPGLSHYAPTPQFARLLLLFLDVEKPYGRDLCQCQFESCRKFFFTIREKAGMPRRKYCTEEHMDMAQVPVSERVRRSREKRKLEEDRKRKPKRRS